MKRVVMIGPARNVHGGVSTMVNNYYAAGLKKRINLCYISTMVDGSKIRKLFQAIFAYLHFLFVLPGMDILHANMSSDASYYRKKIFIETAAFFRKKIIIHFHGGDFQTFYHKKLSIKGKMKVRKTLSKADIFIVLSLEWQDIFLPLINHEKIKILGNAVPLPKYKKGDYSSHDLLFLGRMGHEKGVLELLNIMLRLKARFPDVHLYLAGIWLDNDLEKKAAGMADLITNLGWVDKETQLNYADKCSIFVLPSYFEGQPTSLIEAMSYGMVPVATAVGGIPQIIHDSENGRLIKPKDEDGLYEALVELLDDEELRRTYGEAARKTVEDNFNIVDSVGKLCKIYELCKIDENISQEH